MLMTTKPFRDLTAEDLMSRDVITVPGAMSLPAAAHLLEQAHISGGPVVDDVGCCIGVLSATDFVHWAERDRTPRRTHHAPAPAICSDWQVLEAEETCAGGAVCDHMTTNPVTVAPCTPIGELARMMLDAHIHRVIVVDADDRPIGVVSSTDILAAVAYADIVKGAK